MSARYAIYFIPEPESALARLGSALLGRDSETGEPLGEPNVPGIPPDRLYTLTNDARRYGLHATLKAPFYLKAGMTEQGLIAATSHFILGRQPIALPRLGLERIGSFFALTPARETILERQALQELHTLATDAVSFFDPFRAAPSEAELARRNPEKLSERQRRLLADWGYPYVFDEYRFHITLTDRIPSPEEARWMRPALEVYLNPVLMEGAVISGICVCKQEIDGGQGTAADNFSLVTKIPCRTTPENMVPACGRMT